MLHFVCLIRTKVLWDDVLDFFFAGRIEFLEFLLVV